MTRLIHHYLFPWAVAVLSGLLVGVLPALHPPGILGELTLFGRIVLFWLIGAMTATATFLTVTLLLTHYSPASGAGTYGHRTERSHAERKAA